MRINVEEILSRAEARSKEPQPPPKIRLIKSDEPIPRFRFHIKKASPARKPFVELEKEPKSDLAKSLWTEFSDLKNERNRLSTEISHLVENGADQIRLREQYQKIESFRPQLQDLYDKIQYVEKHGQLPRLPEIQEEPETLASLKLKKEALIDERYKLRKKLEKKVAKNPQRYIEWELRLAQANIEFEAIIDQIKRMEGKA